MKKLLIGLVAIGAVSAFANGAECTRGKAQKAVVKHLEGVVSVHDARALERQEGIYTILFQGILTGDPDSGTFFGLMEVKKDNCKVIYNEKEFMAGPNLNH